MNVESDSQLGKAVLHDLLVTELSKLKGKTSRITISTCTQTLMKNFSDLIAY